jgi:hypothetical protein
MMDGIVELSTDFPVKGSHRTGLYRITKGAFRRPPQRLTVDLSLPQLAEAFIVDATKVPGSQEVSKYFRTKQDQG